MKSLCLPVGVLLVCLAPLHAEAPDAKKTVAWLQALQQADGSFLGAPKQPAGLRATSAAIRALKYLGGEVPDRDKAAKFVDATFDKAAGGFADTPGGKPDVFTTAVGLMAVVELKMPRDKYVEPAVKFLVENAKSFEEVRIGAAGLEAVNMPQAAPAAWQEAIGKLRNPDGTYGKGDGQARDTGGAVAAVLRLGGKVEQPENVVQALKAGQRPDGGYGKADARGSDLETTYRVARALHMLKEKPDVEALHTFVAKCRNADGGYGIVPGEPATVAGTYYAAIIRHWFPGK
jgi:hypothetical protein